MEKLMPGDTVKIYVHGGYYHGKQLVSEEYSKVLSVEVSLDDRVVWLDNGEGNDPSGPYVNGRYDGPFGFYNIIEKFDGEIPPEDEE